MRMALILKLLAEREKPFDGEMGQEGGRCENPRCITSCEQELSHRFKISADGKTRRCVYCEAEEKS